MFFLGKITFSVLENPRKRFSEVVEIEKTQAMFYLDSNKIPNFKLEKN